MLGFDDVAAEMLKTLSTPGGIKPAPYVCDVALLRSLRSGLRGHAANLGGSAGPLCTGIGS